VSLCERLESGRRVEAYPYDVLPSGASVCGNGGSCGLVRRPHGEAQIPILGAGAVVTPDEIRAIAKEEDLVRSQHDLRLP
jgi:hypothetical protein